MTTDKDLDQQIIEHNKYRDGCINLLLIFISAILILIGILLIYTNK